MIGNLKIERRNIED